MASLAQIREFLASKRIAVAGVSRNPRDFTRMLFRELRNRNYDVAPVNPNAPEVEGIRCFASIAEVSPAPDAALLLTPLALCGQLTGECARAGIQKVWVYRRNAEPAPEGVSMISGECPFMFLEHTGGIHRFHGFCRKVVGSYPK
jgi:uncharacterized protein